MHRCEGGLGAGVGLGWGMALCRGGGGSMQSMWKGWFWCVWGGGGSASPTHRRFWFFFGGGGACRTVCLARPLPLRVGISPIPCVDCPTAVGRLQHPWTPEAGTVDNWLLAGGPLGAAGGGGGVAQGLGSWLC